MLGNGRIQALLESLLRVELPERTQVLVLEGYLWFDARIDYGGPYTTELTAIVDENGNPVPFTLLEGSIKARVPKVIKRRSYRTWFKIALQPAELDPEKFTRTHYAIIKKTYLYDRLPTFMKKHIDWFWDWRAYIDSLDMRSKEHYIATLSKNLIDYLIQRAGADKNQVYKLLRKMLI